MCLPTTWVKCIKFQFGVSAILNSKGDKSEKLCFIMGDYNLDLLKYETHEQTELFLNDLLSHSFLCTKYYPTRITDTAATLIDNIFIIGVNNKFESAIVYSEISDHLPVVVHYSLKV